MPHPNPIAGWKFCYSDNPIRSNRAILDDYKEYISTLSQKQQESIGSIDIYEDMAGQHAVRIIIPLDGTYLAHILIYDKNNKRIEVIKYVAGYYMS